LQVKVWDGNGHALEFWGIGSLFRREKGDLFRIRLGRAFEINDILNTDTTINLISYTHHKQIHNSTKSTSPELHQGAFEETTFITDPPFRFDFFVHYQALNLVTVRIIMGLEG